MATKKRTPLDTVTLRPAGTHQQIDLIVTDRESTYREKNSFIIATLDGSEELATVVVSAYSTLEGAEFAAKQVQDDLKCGRTYGPRMSARLKREGFMVVEYGIAMEWAGRVGRFPAFA